MLDALAVELGHLDAEEVRDDVERRAEPEQEDLPAERRVSSPWRMSLISRTAKAQTAARPPVIGRCLAGDDVRVEEDEAAEEDLDER